MYDLPGLATDFQKGRSGLTGDGVIGEGFEFKSELLYGDFDESDKEDFKDSAGDGFEPFVDAGNVFEWLSGCKDFGLFVANGLEPSNDVLEPSLSDERKLSVKDVLETHLDDFSCSSVDFANPSVTAVEFSVFVELFRGSFVPLNKESCAATGFESPSKEDFVSLLVLSIDDL
jgi:hypothetical protein